MATTDLDLGRYKLGWSDVEDYVFKPKKGSTPTSSSEMSWMKGEPDWMRDFRLKALRHFERKPDAAPGCGDMSEIYFNDIYYYIKPTDGAGRRLGRAPRRRSRTPTRSSASPRPSASTWPASPPSTSPRSSTTRNREDLEAPGRPLLRHGHRAARVPRAREAVLRHGHPAQRQQVRRAQLGRLVGRLFIYVPPGVKVEMPLQAYFRINAENMGQFERTLIIADEGARCTTSRAARPRSTPPTRCTRPWSSSSPSPAPASPTRRSRTGRTTSTTWSPSGPASRPRATWSGSTATSARASP